MYTWGKAIPATAPVPQWLGGSNYTKVYDSILPGSMSYELSNHLGNVLSVISDKKIGLPLNDTTVAYYVAEVLSQNDYYPFGMLMPGRRYLPSTGGAGGGSLYRYGFNGKENDNDVKGEGNQQDYGMRIYDPRLGKFLSVDPLTKSYPWNSTYAFAENSIMNYIDLDGLGKANIQVYNIYKTGKTELTTTNYYENLGTEKWEGVMNLKQFNIVDEKGNVTAIYTDYDEKKKQWQPGTAELKLAANNIKRIPEKVSFFKSVERGAEGFYVFFIKPDPLVEGSEKFNQTVKDAGYYTLMVFTAGASSTLTIGKGVQGFLATKFGKGAFDVVSQALVKGSFEDIDWSDAAAQALFNNSVFRDAVKSIFDASSKEGFQIKKLNNALQEFGLRISLTQASSHMNEGGQRYVIDVLKKEQLRETKEQLNKKEKPRTGGAGGDF